MAGLSLATRGSGGPRLARHLLNGHDNEQVIHRPGRGLMADDLESQINEIRLLGRGARTTRTLLHINLNPSIQLTPEQRQEFESRWWAAMEAEFGLQEAAYAEVQHHKHGRWHTHRAYDLTCGGLRLVNISHDFARRQRILAEVAYAMGLDCPPIAHPRKVIRALEKMGKPEIAQHVRDTWRKEERLAAAVASSSPGTPPVPVSAEAAPLIVAPISPRERMQEARTGVRKKDVAAAVVAAWDMSDDGASFAAALRAQGFRLGTGDKVPTVLDAAGGSHAVGRLLASGLKAAGRDSKGMQAAGTNRLKEVELPPLDAVRELPAPAVQAQPVQTAIETPTEAVPPAAIAPEVVETANPILVSLPEVTADTPAAVEDLSIDEIAEVIEAHIAKQKAQAAAEKAQDQAAKAAQEAAERSRPVQTEPPIIVSQPVETEVPIIITRPTTPDPAIAVQRSGRFSPENMRRAAYERAAQHFAALQAQYDKADRELTKALRASNQAWAQHREAWERSVSAHSAAGAAWERAKMIPLQEEEARAQVAYKRAVADLQRHEDTATGINTWRKVPALDRAWTETRTRLQAVVDTARQALEDAKAAIRSLRLWFTSPAAAKERTEAQAAAREAIVRPLREAAEALDAQKAEAEVHFGKTNVALVEAREARNLAFQRFRAIEAEMLAAKLKPDDDEDPGDKPTS